MDYLKNHLLVIEKNILYLMKRCKKDHQIEMFKKVEKILLTFNEYLEPLEKIKIESSAEIFTIHEILRKINKPTLDTKAYAMQHNFDRIYLYELNQILKTIKKIHTFIGAVLEAVEK